MKIVIKTLLFSIALILLIPGISNAEVMDFKIGESGGAKSKSLFFGPPHTSWLDQNALNLFREIFQQTVPVYQNPSYNMKRSIISFCLSGGINNIDGGDLNSNIRDSNTRYEALNMITDPYNNIMHWKEMKWMPHLKGEFILRIFKQVGLGLGFEYITKTNPRRSTLSRFRGRGEGTTMESFSTFSWSGQSEHKLTVLPITFNVYYFIPIGRVVEAFITGGVGYYMGDIKFDESSSAYGAETYDYFTASGDFVESLRYQNHKDSTFEFEVKSNTIGFQGGLGFDCKISSAISLIFEGNYRFVSFENWEGSGGFTMDGTQKVSYLVGSYSEEIDVSESGAYDGKLWFYEYHDTSADDWYDVIDFYEEKPEDDTQYRNIREGEINFGGFVFRAGFRISF